MENYLFKIVICNSDTMKSVVAWLMDNELEMLWKEAVIVENKLCTLTNCQRCKTNYSS